MGEARLSIRLLRRWRHPQRRKSAKLLLRRPRIDALALGEDA
jgi:hypothetical protein